MIEFELTLPPWAHVSEERRGHIRRVGVLVARWADALSVDRTERMRWLRAVALHDALKDAPVTLLRDLAPNAWGVDSLRHGPAAAALAAQHGERDEGVLQAIHYHSVGYAGWDTVGRMLYLADYLEPGRGARVEYRTALAERVPQDPRGVLRTVAAERLGLSIAAGHRLLPEAVAFWNALTCDDSD